MCSKGTKAFVLPLEKAIFTTTASMSRFRLTCLLKLVLEFISTGWTKKELYWVYVAAKLVPAALLARSGGPSWPKAKAAAQLLLLEVSWGEWNWDLGMECLLIIMSPWLDQTPERRQLYEFCKQTPTFHVGLGFFPELKVYFNSWKQQVYHLRVSIFHETWNPIILNSFSFLKYKLWFL